MMRLEIERLKTSGKVKRLQNAGLENLYRERKMTDMFLFTPNEQTVCRCTQRCTELKIAMTESFLCSQQRHFLLMFTVTAADLAAACT